MIITPLTNKKELESLQDYFAKLTNRPYEFLTQLNPPTLTGYLRAGMADQLAFGSRILVAHTECGPCGLLAWTGLPFDTSLFEVNVAKLVHISAIGSWEERISVLEALLACASENWHKESISLVYAKVKIEQVDTLHVLRKHAFDTVAGWINYGIWVDNWEPGNFASSVAMRPSRPDDLTVLEGLSAGSFSLDRFHTDPRISPTRADQMHAYWIRNSINGSACDAVLVAEDDSGRPVGFLTYNLRDEEPEHLGDLRIASVILNAVDPKCRRQGIYSQMLSMVLLECQGQVDFLQVETQTNNTPVQRCWCNLGLRPVESGLNLHWWSEDGKAEEES
jgi:ribosomal protein S18 acetylase RimI-like enzyme